VTVLPAQGTMSEAFGQLVNCDLRIENGTGVPWRGCDRADRSQTAPARAWRKLVNDTVSKPGDPDGAQPRVSHRPREVLA